LAFNQMLFFFAALRNSIYDKIYCKGWCRPRIRPTIFSFTGHNQIKWSFAYFR